MLARQEPTHIQIQLLKINTDQVCLFKASLSHKINYLNVRIIINAGVLLTWSCC